MYHKSNEAKTLPYIDGLSKLGPFAKCIILLFIIDLNVVYKETSLKW